MGQLADVKGSGSISWLAGVVNTGYLDITSASAVATGVYASVENTTGQDIIIWNATLDISTESTGASTVDVGIAADATTTDDTIFDGKSLATAGIFHSENDTDNGSNGTGKPIVWGSGEFLNVAEASGNVEGVVGNLLFQWSVR